MYLRFFSCASGSAVAETDSAENEIEKKFIYLASRRNVAAMEKFLAAYPDVNMNYIDEEGFTGIQYSIGYKFSKMALFLIDKGVDLNVVTRNNWVMVTSGWSIQVVNERSTPLHFALFWNLSDIVAKLIEKNADVTIQNAEGFTPLHMAAYYTMKEAANMLLEAGATNTALNNEGHTPSESARAYGNKTIAMTIEAKTKN